MLPAVSEEDLIAAAKPYFKAKGFKKKNKRWTKNIGEFTLSFLIEGSSFSKENYYIRPGVYVNEFADKEDRYGHFMKGIEISTIEQIFNDTEKFFSEWTNHALIKEKVTAFIEWDKRNPLEKRRAKQVDYDKDPPPTDILFPTHAFHLNVMEYILENY